MKKTLLIITIFLTSLLLVSCNGERKITPTQEDTTDKLVVWASSDYWGGENGKLVAEMVKIYTEETGIEIIYQPQPNLRDKVKGSALGGETADVIIWDRWETVSFVEENRLVDLTEYLAADGIDLAEYQQEALSEMQYENGLYGLPLDIDAWGYWVNKTLVKEANVRRVADGLPEVKELPSTWDELRETAIATTQRDQNGKMTVAGLNVDSAGSFYSYIQTAGGKLLDKDANGKTIAAFNTEYGEAVIKFWYDLVHVDKVYEQGVLSTQGGADDAFVTQKVAIQSNSLLNGAKFYDQYVGDKFEYEFIPFPKGPSKEFANQDNLAGSNGGGLMGGFGLVIPKTSKHQKAAWDLIKWWITDTDKVIRWSEISQLIPAKISVIEELREKNIPNVRNVLDVLPDLKVRPKDSGFTSVETSVIMALIPTVLFADGYIKGNNTTEKRIQALLKDMEKKANETFAYAQMY